MLATTQGLGVATSLTSSNSSNHLNISRQEDGGWGGREEELPDLLKREGNDMILKKDTPTLRVLQTTDELARAPCA